MNQDKIDKLLRLAYQGVGGEAENAKSILRRAGIDWTKHNPTFVQKVRNVFRVRATFKFTFSYNTDIFFMSVIVNHVLNINATIALLLGHSIEVGPISYEDKLTIDKIYTPANRERFNQAMNSVVLSSLK